ncbi:MAG: hypothetical protein ACFFCQ_06115 [Promethearchaeota archaeon]
MIVIPIGIESLGVRGSCFFVETADCNILIDPSVSLCPKRDRLPPHIMEIACSWYTRLKILHYAEKADILIQTHYHGDHFTLFQNRNYEFATSQIAKRIYSPEKRIFAKDPHIQLSRNQQLRAKALWDLKGLTVEPADDKTIEIGDTKLVFSKSLWHGNTNAPMGTVVAVSIQRDNAITTFSSDCNGPGTEEATQFLIDSQADVCFVDGPSSYLKNRIKEKQVDTAFKRLLTVAETAKLVVDHHAPRDLYWKETQEKYGSSFPTCAKYFGVQPFCAEARRRELFNDFPFPRNFYSQFFKNPDKVITQLEETMKTIIEKYQWDKLALAMSEYNDLKQQISRL